ncbi:hypothetical protein D3C75_1039820 [compost metagenome]
MSLIADQSTVMVSDDAAVTTQASVAPVVSVVAEAILALPLVALAIPDIENWVFSLKEMVWPASAPTWKVPV